MIKRRTSACWPLLFFLFYGCAHVTPVAPSYVVISEPASNEPVTKSVGEELLVKGNIYTLKSIDLFADANGGDVRAGTYVLEGYYGPKSVYLPVPLTGAELTAYLLAEKRMMRLFFDENKRELCSGFINGYGYVMCREAIPAANYKASSYILETRNSFQRTLLYTGKEGDIVKFTYREFMNDMARPAFTVDVSYDLKDGDVIGFKTAKLKIIKATNSSVTYEVLKNFD